MHDTAAVPRPKWKEGRWSVLALGFNSGKRFVGALRHRPVRTGFWTALIFFILYAERPYFQPLFLSVAYLPGLLIAAGSIYSLWLVIKRCHARAQAAGGLVGLAVAVVVVLWGPWYHDYSSSWLRYASLRHQIVDLTGPQDMYRTYDDRILPLAGVAGLLQDRMTDNESPAPPDLVKSRGGYVWTSAVEPALSNWWGRFAHDVTEMIVIPATETTPDFSRRERVNVNFDVGENLFFSRNIDTCVRRSFGPLRIFSYRPGNVLRIQDDNGRWVYAVSLSRQSWGINPTSWFFPWPEAGGVQIIEQNGPYSKFREWAWEWPKHVLFGCGHWIPPEEIGKHAFLRGQNIVPYEVSRFAAESNQFQAGFLGPTKWSKQGAVRIADVAEDLNLQPYVTPAWVRDPKSGKLYQWFGLEPFSKDKCGLSMSYLAPADGIGPQYRYNHAALKESPIGPSCIADRVRAREGDTYWANRRPAEPLPYAHEIADSNGNVAVRLMFKTVEVTKREKEGEVQYIPATPPKVWIIDAYREWPVLVGKDPKAWDEELRKELDFSWAKKP